MIFSGCAPAGEGWNEPEKDLLGPFVWTRGRFSLTLAAPARFLLFECHYGGSDGRLASARSVAHTPLRRGWQIAGLDLGSIRIGLEALAIDPIVPVENDARELGLEIRRIEATNDAERFERLLAREANARENEAEFRSGAAVLRSTPPHLRISVERRCNIAPRCVYCEWDWETV